MPQLKKSKLVGFQADETMHQRVKETARAAGFDTYADWMRNITTTAIDSEGNKPTSYDTDVLSNLAKIYAGYFAPRLQHSLASAQADQPKLVHDLLEALAEHLARGCDPRDIIICPRAEWKPEPYLAQVAEPAASYPAPNSPVDEVVAAEDTRRSAAPAAGGAPTVLTKASIRAQAKAAAPSSGQS